MCRNKTTLEAFADLRAALRNAWDAILRAAKTDLRRLRQLFKKKHDPNP